MHATHKNTAVGSACLLTKVRRAHEYIVPSLLSSFVKSEASDVGALAALFVGPAHLPALRVLCVFLSVAHVAVRCVTGLCVWDEGAGIPSLPLRLTCTGDR